MPNIVAGCECFDCARQRAEEAIGHYPWSRAGVRRTYDELCDEYNRGSTHAPRFEQIDFRWVEDFRWVDERSSDTWAYYRIGAPSSLPGQPQREEVPRISRHELERLVENYDDQRQLDLSGIGVFDTNPIVDFALSHLPETPLGYENPECPARCPIPHRVIRRNPNRARPSYLQFTCPFDQYETIYAWCDEHREWIEDPYSGFIFLSSIPGYVCSLSEHDYFECYNCSVISSVSYMYNHDEEWYCRRCYENLDRYDEYSGDDDRCSGPTDYVSFCSDCSTGNVHLDEMTGKYLCKCKADIEVEAGGIVRFFVERTAA